MTFQLKIVSEHEPLNQDPYFAWLSQNIKKGQKYEKLPKLQYLESLGFVKGRDKLTSEQLKILDYVEEVWYRATPWHLTPLHFVELFNNSEPKFYIYNHPQHRGITPLLKSIVVQSGWIYGVHPNTTYFEIIGDKLYAKYQQIIGSRFLCTIKDLS